MNKTYLGDIELGKRKLTMNSLEKIVAGYDLTVKEFFPPGCRIDERALGVAGATFGRVL